MFALCLPVPTQHTLFLHYCTIALLLPCCFHPHSTLTPFPHSHPCHTPAVTVLLPPTLSPSLRSSTPCSLPPFTTFFLPPSHHTLHHTCLPAPLPPCLPPSLSSPLPPSVPHHPEVHYVSLHPHRHWGRHGSRTGEGTHTRETMRTPPGSEQRRRPPCLAHPALIQPTHALLDAVPQTTEGLDTNSSSVFLRATSNLYFMQHIPPYT